MLNFAFIFARGGSKGLPKKNIKPLCGKPLIQYSIDVAKESESIDKVFVSTDDADIAHIAKELGAIIIQRPVELATDTASEWKAWQHAIKWVQEHYGEFDEFVSLPATSPLRSVEDVEKAIAKRISTKNDACISITPASRSPYFNMVKKSDADLISLVIGDSTQVNRRQDAPQVFDITTVVYVLNPHYILENQGLFDGKITAIQIPKERAVDIDDIYDFKFAESLLTEANNNEK